MMMLTVITPVGKTLEASVTKVFLPGGAGAFEVLKNHAPLVSTLTEGVVRYEEAGSMKEYPVSGGFVKVENNTIVVCTEK